MCDVLLSAGHSFRLPGTWNKQQLVPTRHVRAVLNRFTFHIGHRGCQRRADPTRTRMKQIERGDGARGARQLLNLGETSQTCARSDATSINQTNAIIVSELQRSG